MVMDRPLMEGTEDPPLATSLTLDDNSHWKSDVSDSRVPADYVPSNEDDGPISSVEAQADPSDFSSFDLDFEMSEGQPEVVTALATTGETSFGAWLPNNGDHSTSNVAIVFDPVPLAVLLDQTDGASLPEEQTGVDDIKSDGASAGVCGFRNFANTCYMNSGLQCLFATPAVVRYFTQTGSKEEPTEVTADAEHPCLSAKFGPLLNDIWSGQYSILKPSSFKSSLELAHPQFKGAHQHDCQEFLALLLGSLHEELKAQYKLCGHREFDKCASSYGCGTSMEMHTPYSTERDVPVNMVGWTPRKCSSDTKLNLKEPAKQSSDNQTTSAFGCSSSTTGPSSQVELHTDGTESRGSASPKSYDSTSSSLEDKVASAIRTLPIPNEVKAAELNEEADFEVIEEEEEDSRSSSAHSSSKAIITSNLVPTDTLKKRPIHSGRTAPNEANNKTKERDDLDFLTKENKTLNVNVSVNGSNGFYGAEIQNNKMNFDSEKFHNPLSQNLLDKKVRPHEAIDNNLGNLETDSDRTTCKDVWIEGTGCCKDKNDEAAIINDYQAIKRMRLDSSDKEKNIQLEMERQQREQSVSEANMLDGVGLMAELEGREIDGDSSSADMNQVPAVVAGVDASSRHGSGACGMSSQTNNLKEAVEADRCWEKYLTANDTIVARTFQGQFKNTVVCSKCGYISVSFEPFMYLPVPLPNAHLRQTVVTFVSAAPDVKPVTFLLQLTYADNVAKLKEQLMELDKGPFCVRRRSKTSRLQVAEVSDHRVSRIVDDWTSLKYLNHNEENKFLYVIEVAMEDGPPAELSSATASKVESPKPEDVPYVDPEELLRDFTPAFPTIGTTVADTAAATLDAVVPDLVGSFSVNEPHTPAISESKQNSCDNDSYQSCVICMEDFATSLLRQHDACDCVMCSPCLDRTVEHNQQEESINCALGLIKCPGCRQDVNPETEFVPLNMVGQSVPKLRLLTLPVVFRCYQGQIRKQSISLFGHPGFIEVPNLITGEQLAELVNCIHPHSYLKGSNDSLLTPEIQDLKHSEKFVLVNGQGKNCSRCVDGHCFGCVTIDPLDGQTKVLLQPGDTVAVSCLADDVPHGYVEEANKSDQHSSVDETPRVKEKLQLDDCLKAFSENEILDENNPWFCPVCRKNQCAIKTLTVWRFPDYLILYLKRFVFLSSSTGALKLEKDVEFQVNNLDLTPYLSGPLQHGHSSQGDGRPVFDLYACVCHFGTVYGGHYTAYSKHLESGHWNHFDDNTVSQHKVPGESEGDSSSAYVLFFQRAGLRKDSQLPFVSRKCQAFALGEGQNSLSATHTTRLDGLKPNNSEDQHPRNQGEHQKSEDQDEDMAPTCPDLSQLIRSLDTPPPS